MTWVANLSPCKGQICSIDKLWQQDNVTLLFSGLMPMTSARESTVQAAIEKKSHETIMFFNIDLDPEHHRADKIGAAFNGKRCDLLVFYKNRSDPDSAVKLCLVELKKSKVEVTKDQLGSTVKHLSDKKMLSNLDDVHLVCITDMASPLTSAKREVTASGKKFSIRYLPPKNFASFLRK
jgi:hypothetical protein